MTSSPGSPGKHAAPAPLVEEYDDWLSAPAHAAPPSGLPGGFGHVRPAPVQVQAHTDDWVTAPTFEDAFAAYTSQTTTAVPATRAPSHAAAQPEPDPWPTVSFTGDPPAWETPYEPQARSHRRAEVAAETPIRSHPLAFGLIGLMVGLAVSLVVLKVVSLVFPSLLPSL